MTSHALTSESVDYEQRLTPGKSRKGRRYRNSGSYGWISTSFPTPCFLSPFRHSIIDFFSEPDLGS